MKNVWKNYKQTIILLGAIILGAIVGLVWGEGALALKPFGDIFINLMLVVIVPLIFLTITSAIIKMDSPKRLGKIMSRIVVAFVVMSVVAVLIAVVVTYNVPLVEAGDSGAVMALFDESSVIDTELSVLERTVVLLTVGDFSELLSRNNIIAIFVFPILFALAMRRAGEKAEPVKKVILSLNDIVINIITIIMYYAPIGLGCYFAALIASYGQSIALGFLKTFLVYTVVCVVVYVVLYSVYALLAGGKRGLSAYWRNILPPTATALATCSSAASIPVNVAAIKAIGVPDDIAETTVPMGTSCTEHGVTCDSKAMSCS